MSATTRRAISLASRIAAACGAAIVLAGQAGRVLPLLDALNALLPPLLVLLALALIPALVRRDRVTAGLALIGLLVGGWQFLPAISPRSSNPAPASGPRLRVLTLSTRHDNPDPKALERVIAVAAPDLVLLQETDGTTAPAVAQLLPQFARARSCAARACSLTVLSRWPIRREPAERAAGTPALPDLLVARVDTPFGGIRVIDVHLPRLHRANAGKFREALIATARMSKDQPLIVGGDFNLATGSLGLDDVARRSGLTRVEGFLPSYPAHLPFPALIGIDHVLVSRHWRSAGCARTPAGGSDHRGVVCILSAARAEK